MLLIAPRFFGYDKDIATGISRRGAHVDFLPDRPFDTPLMTALTRSHPAFVLAAADRLYRRLLDGFAAKHYDAVLVVNGQTLSRHTLRLLRTAYPSARLVLYMWDSIENRGRALDTLPFYDQVFSFDPDSATKYNMQLRPLFFSPGFERAPVKSPDFDLSFIGTMHTDRYAVLSRLRRHLPKGLATYWYLYLQAPWVYHLYRMLKPAMRDANMKEFKFVPLAKATLQSVFAASSTVLDIEHPRQRGLTMRTFESLGSHKKLITTNSQVRKYDFYSDKNICVIDRATPQVPEDFWSTPFERVEDALYRRYSLAGWLDDVLGVNELMVEPPSLGHPA